MTSEKLPKEYQQWIEEEKALSNQIFESYKKSKGKELLVPTFQQGM